MAEQTYQEDDGLATLVVLEARGRRVARQTFSPVSALRPLSPEALAAWLDAPRGR